MSDVPVRASSIGGILDCERKEAAKWLLENKPKKAYEYGIRPKVVGAAAEVGSATHAGTAYMLMRKKETGTLAPLKEAQEVAVSYWEAVAPTVDPEDGWDKTTPDINAGTKQITKLVEAYTPIALSVEPVHIEVEFRREVQPGIEVTGHMDVAEPMTVRDLKTGKERPHVLQMAAYAFLLENDDQTYIANAIIDYVPRTKTGAGKVFSVAYDVLDFVGDVKSIALSFGLNMQYFLGTGDKSVFKPNPYTPLCSKKYCPAHDSGFCKFGYKGERLNDYV